MGRDALHLPLEHVVLQHPRAAVVGALHATEEEQPHPPLHGRHPCGQGKPLRGGRLRLRRPPTSPFSKRRLWAPPADGPAREYSKNGAAGWFGAWLRLSGFWMERTVSRALEPWQPPAGPPVFKSASVLLDGQNAPLSARLSQGSWFSFKSQTFHFS